MKHFNAAGEGSQGCLWARERLVAVRARSVGKTWRAGSDERLRLGRGIHWGRSSPGVNDVVNGAALLSRRHLSTFQSQIRLGRGTGTGRRAGHSQETRQTAVRSDTPRPNRPLPSSLFAKVAEVHSRLSAPRPPTSSTLTGAATAFSALTFPAVCFKSLSRGVLVGAAKNICFRKDPCHHLHGSQGPRSASHWPWRRRLPSFRFITAYSLMSTRTVILAGAPDSARLDFSENTLFPDLPAGQAGASITSQATDISHEAFSAQWRQLSTERLQMRPALPKLNINARLDKELDKGPAEFFAPAEFFSGTPTSNRDSSNDSYISGASTDDAPSELLEFYDHSFSIHEAVPTSQLSALSEVTPGTPTYESNEEMFLQTSGGTGGIIRSASQRRLSQIPQPKHLSDLEDIPNADHLHSIEPQTMTVNLIVAILSISEPRTVMTGAKYGKPRETELVEVLVGDETKTGFSITMWLPREMHVNWKDGVKSTPEGSRSALRRDLKMLRPRDVVVLQNVALSSFRGKVHGQSLKKDVTKVNLLFRRKVNDEDIGGVYSASSLRHATDSDPQLLKVKRVRDWMAEFVGEPKTSGPRGARRRILPLIPSKEGRSRSEDPTRRR